MNVRELSPFKRQDLAYALTKMQKEQGIEENAFSRGIIQKLQEGGTLSASECRLLIRAIDSRPEQTRTYLKATYAQLLGASR